MFEIIAAVSELVLRPDVAAAVIAGAVGGVIIGAVPGVGPAVAIAILLPATFQFEPMAGLALLLGVYGSSMFGGAVPAVLINTPGTAMNALTTYDGYPMTQRGEPQRALSIAYSASLFGGVFSIICLVFLVPVLSSIAPYFGSRDIFMAALMGMVLVILAHRRRTLPAAALVCFGMFLNFIGIENVRYTQRYTFDMDWLGSGFNLIVVILGLFALSQAFTLLLAENKTPSVPKLKGGAFSGVRDLFRHKLLAVVSAGLGTVMGVIPGVGEFTAQFFAYTFARKISKNPEMLGKGAPEGLIASEAANNAVPAAAMVPLLALGIPGEALTAMMLSVFYVHGVIPGPKLFETQPYFLYGLFTVLLAVNVVVVLFLLVSNRALIQVVRVPERIVGIFILTLSLVGVYTLRNSLVDCAVASAFGILGFVLKRLDLPVVPLVLGMVLGRIADEKFRASMARVETPLDFIDRPVSGAIFVLIIAALALHIAALYRDFRRRAGG
ncbi:MAG: tripartite tricarboxylate transporter permease [Rhodospirillales bacterium]